MDGDVSNTAMENVEEEQKLEKLVHVKWLKYSANTIIHQNDEVSQYNWRLESQA